MKLNNPVLFTSNFVSSLKVNSLITISVPHDGRKYLSSEFKRRNVGVTCRDMLTWPIANGINEDVAVCNIVRGHLRRVLVDYNRAPFERGQDHALVDPHLGKYYDEYHNTIRKFLRTSMDLFGKALLIDLHGFVNQPPIGNFDIILGTCHRQSVKTDIDQKLAEFLRKNRYSVYLPENKKVDGEKFSGRYTVQHHGQLENVDAIQLEIASHLRQKSDHTTSKKLSLDLRAFFLEYLKDF